MNEPTHSRTGLLGASTSDDSSLDPATAQQLACLRFLDIAVSGPITHGQAGVLIERAEADPAYRDKLRSWHQAKTRLHPNLFARQPRSFKEARQWMALFAGDNIYGYDFREPTANQTMVVLESLDKQEADWDQGDKTYREQRFMNELATLSPELCKPGCSFPRALAPKNDSRAPDAAAPGLSAPKPPSAPSFPGLGTSTLPGHLQSPAAPGWQPPALPASLPSRAAAPAPAGRKGGLLGWVALLSFLALGAAAFAVFGGHVSSPLNSAAAQDQPSKDKPSSAPAVASASTSPARSAVSLLPPVSAKESQQRAMKKYPELAKTGSLLNQKFVAAFQQLQSTGNPRLQQPDWPERLADECAGVSTPAPAAKGPAAAAPTTVANTTRTPASPAPTASPAGPVSVSMDAAYKSKSNTTKFNERGRSQSAIVEVDLHSMGRTGAKFTLRCIFFKRPDGRSDLRTVLSKDDKSIELAAGQRVSETFESAAVPRYWYNTNEFDGWLVQLFPEGSTVAAKVVGSTGPIEEMGKQLKF